VPIVVVPFLIFFACCVVQFWCYRRIRQVLVDNHPDFWLELSRKAWFVDNAVMRFAFSRKARSFDDPLLMARIREIKILGVTTIVAWLSFAGLMISGLGGWPVDP
jgi:hypothetical protein